MKGGVPMKYSFFKKNGQAERSYRIGISLLSLLFLISMLISGIGGFFSTLTDEEALQKGFLFPTRSSVSITPARDQFPEE